MLHRPFPAPRAARTSSPTRQLLSPLSLQRLAGQIGSRNVIRGQGPFSLDMGLSKRFYLFAYKDQPHTLQFRAEAFNITNTVRFDPNSQANVNSNSGGIMSLADPNKFGQYSSTFGTPRVFQFSARYEF